MQRPSVTHFITFAAIAFLLNLSWEFSHARLYTCCTAGAFMHAGLLIWATLGDVMYLMGIGGVGWLVFRNDWLSFGKKQTTFLIFLGLLTAIFIEVKGLTTGKWAYTTAMPTIFGIGLTPLVQLAVTGMLSYWFAARLFKQSNF